MSQFVIAALRRRSFGGSKGALQGNPASDRILRGPDCNRHSRVCADASVCAGLPRRSDSDGHRDAFSEASRNLSIRWWIVFQSKLEPENAPGGSRSRPSS